MAKKFKSIQAWLIPILRQASRRWPNKVQARYNSRIIMDDGFFKNGKKRTKVMYVCQNPECGQIVDKFGGHIDHKNPVVGIDGFTNWDDYISGLFCELENLWHLCLSCHDAKSKTEQKERSEVRRIKKLTKL